MTDIGSAVRAAGRTLAALFNGAHILCELLVEQVELSVIGVYMAMTAISGGVDAVKKVHAPVHTL